MRREKVDFFLLFFFTKNLTPFCTLSPFNILLSFSVFFFLQIGGGNRRNEGPCDTEGGLFPSAVGRGGLRRMGPYARIVRGVLLMYCMLYVAVVVVCLVIVYIPVIKIDQKDYTLEGAEGTRI